MNFLNSKVPLMVPLLSNVWIKARSNNDDFYLALNEMSGIQPRNEIIQKFHHLAYICTYEGHIECNAHGGQNWQLKMSS